MHSVDLPRITTHRQTRRLLLAVLRHLALGGLALGAGATLAAVWLIHSPRWEQRASGWLQARLTAEITPRLAAFERALQSGDDDAAVSAAARDFLSSVPRGHPSDAYGASTRHALHALFNAAGRSGDLPARLDAGERAGKFDPNDSILLWQHGRALIDAGRRAEAATVLEAAFRIRPTSPQILHALEHVLDASQAARRDELIMRHHEALALCMTLPAWMSGNLVVAGPRTQAFDIRLSIDREVVLGGPLEFPPEGIYLVLPRVPELELRLVSARLIESDGRVAELDPRPQDGLTPLPGDDGFVRITPPNYAGLDDHAVIGFVLPPERPFPARLEVRIFCRPSPNIARVMEVFGTWRHPGVKAVLSD